MIEADFGNKQRDRLPDSVIAEVKRGARASHDAQGDVLGLRQHHRQGRQTTSSPGRWRRPFGSVALTGDLATVDLRRRASLAGR